MAKTVVNKGIIDTSKTDVEKRQQQLTEGQQGFDVKEATVVEESEPSRKQETVRTETQKTRQPSSEQRETIQSKEESSKSVRPSTMASIADVSESVKRDVVQSGIRDDGRRVASADQYSEESDNDALADVQIPTNIQATPMSMSMPKHSEEKISGLIKKEREEEQQEADDVFDIGTAANDLSLEMDNIEPNPNDGAPRMPDRDDITYANYPTRRYSNAVEESKRRAKSGVRKKMFRGYAIYEKISGWPTIGMQEVSIGSEFIAELLEQPKNNLINIINEETDFNIDPLSPTVIEDVINAINNSNIRVATFKSPVNRPSSFQSRILRVHTGRGFLLHPIMAKIYNADFDGDDMTVSFDRKTLKKCNDAMAYLVDLDGNVALDPDFFPPARLVGNDAIKTKAVEYLAFDVLKNRSREDKEKIIAKLVAWGESQSEENLKELAMAISQVCDKYKSKKFEVMADILSSIYSGMRKLHIAQAELHPDVEIVDVPKIQTNNRADKALMSVVEDMVMGHAPNNMQDMKVMLCSYLGEAGDNKNVAFRFTADIAKLYHLDDRIRIGEDGFVVSTDEGFNALYEGTMKFAMTLRISGEAARASKAKYASDLIRDEVISRVGFPSDERYNSFEEFLMNFRNIYSSMERLINVANAALLTNMEFVDNGNLVTPIGGNTVGDMITPFINIYGDRTVESLFGRWIRFGKDTARQERGGKIRETWTSGGISFVLDKYKDRTLRSMSKNNRIIENQDAIKSTKEKSITNNQNLAIDMLNAAADAKTSAASEFNTKIYGADQKKDAAKTCVVARMFELVQEINKLIENKETRDYKLFVDDIVELLYWTGPNLFDHFGMDNASAFLNSKYGKAILNAKNTEQLGSIRLAMVAEYRLSKISNEIYKLNDLRESNARASRIAIAENRISLEMDQLASSSTYWHGIIKEMRSTKRLSAFENLKNKENVGMFLNAAEYWKSPMHDNVIDVLHDITISKSLKEAIVSDVVRWQEDYPTLQAWELGYQMELDESPAWNDLPPTSTSVFDVVKDFEGRFNSFKKKSYKALRDDIDKAHSMYGDQEGSLINTLETLAKNPSLLIRIDDGLYADAISATLDKISKQSEKSGQNPAANAIYYALNMQRSGGMFDDVYRTDDRAIGIQNEMDVSILDIVRLLADPKHSITVYNSEGKYTILSRDILCGVDNATESDIWSFMQRNPRIAACIRVHEVSVNSNVRGDGSLVATHSITETIGQYNNGAPIDEQIKAELRNHPTFGAIVALLTPTHNAVSRNIRNRYIENEQKLVNWIFSMALAKKNNNEDLTISEFIDEKLGLTKEAIDNTDIFKTDGDDIRAQVEGYITKYIDDISEMISGSENAPQTYPFEDGIDIQSCANYFDVKQELSGAKTAISTGIEGAETYNLAIWMASLSPVDKYDIVGSWTEESILEELNGCMTNLGIEIGSMPIEDMEAMSEDGDVIVEVPEGFVVQDKTLDGYGRQISSVNSYLIIKRDNGAESFNLKVKKRGDDGTDRIAKHDKYSDVDYTTKLEDLRYIYKTTGNNLFPVKMNLAQHLKDQNEDIGYKDMDLANYMCIADLMIIEKDGQIYLRSLEQIAYAIKRQVTADTIDNGNWEDLHDEAVTIADTVGLEMIENPLSVLDYLPIHNATRAKPSLKQRSSSWSRNYDLLKTIVDKWGRRQLGPKSLNDYSKRTWKSLKKDTKETIKSIDLAKNYDIIGVIGSNEVPVENPGPKSMWVLDNPKADPTVVRNQMASAYSLGMSVLVMDNCFDLVPAKIRADLIEVSDKNTNTVNAGLLPFFDIRLNGSEATPSPGNIGIFEMSDDQVVIGHEMKLNAHGIGDSDAIFYNSLTDRTNIDYSDSTTISVDRIFPNVFENNKFENCTFDISFANPKDIQKYIVNEFPEPFTIDYGIPQSNRSEFNERKNRIDRLIEKYRRNYKNANQHTGWMKSAKPNEIAGWLVCTIYNGPDGIPQNVLAPIIPFELKGSMETPTQFDIVDMFIGDIYDKNESIDIDGIGLQLSQTNNISSVTVNWRWTGDLKDQWFKMHEGAGTANKMLGMVRDIESPVLKNGMPIDVGYLEATTISRRGGTNRRIKSMESMMFIMRKMGYNFTSSDGAFPNNREEGGIYEQLKVGRISRDVWDDILEDDGFVFHSDPIVNAFVKTNVIKFRQYGGNPSDWLANRFESSRTRVYWEFEGLFEQSFAYEDAMLRFFHSMDSKLCPNGLSIYDANAEYIFRPSSENGWNFGCIQMQVPYDSVNNPGQKFYYWENIYAGISFFDEYFSGFYRPNINGSSNFMDAINTAALANKAPSGFDFRKALQFAASETSRMVESKSLIEIDWKKTLGTGKINKESKEE